MALVRGRFSFSLCRVEKKGEKKREGENNGEEAHQSANFLRHERLRATDERVIATPSNPRRITAIIALVNGVVSRKETRVILSRPELPRKRDP